MKTFINIWITKNIYFIMIIFGKKWGVLVKSRGILVKSESVLVVGAFWPVALLFGVKCHHFNISDTSWRLKKQKKKKPNKYLQSVRCFNENSSFLPEISLVTTSCKYVFFFTCTVSCINIQCPHAWAVHMKPKPQTSIYACNGNIFRINQLLFNVKWSWC